MKEGKPRKYTAKLMMYLPKELKDAFRAKVHAQDKNMSVVFRQLIRALYQGKLVSLLGRNDLLRAVKRMNRRQYYQHWRGHLSELSSSFLLLLALMVLLLFLVGVD